MKHKLITTFCAALLVGSLAIGQLAKPLKMTKSGNATVSGTVKGSSYVDYRLFLGAGQSLSASLKNSASSVDFNVLPPKSSNAAMFNGSMSGNSMSARMVPVAGTYTVRIYQMGDAADSKKVGKFTLSVSAKGTKLKPLPASADAKLKGTPFHASAMVKCKSYLDKSLTQCQASVIRYGGGSATVEFRLGKGLVRRVLFVKGVPKAHDSMETFSHSRSGDDTTIRFGDASEEYTVPDALLFGG